MSSGWDGYKPAPIETFHGEAMKTFHKGAQFKANERTIDDVRYVNGIEVNRIIAEFKTKIMKEYGISSSAITIG